MTSPPATALVLFVAIAFAPSAKGAEFSEGFTDYFAAQALLQGRLITPDLSDFFARYVSGMDMLPVKESPGLAGYRAHRQYYDGELYLVPKSR